MKIHLICGATIGAAINLAFQLTDVGCHLNLIELASCAVLAALAAFTAALVQRPLAVSSPHKRPAFSSSSFS